jgi:CRISPR/Cas system-associated protein Cas7 (RAMP superfamily)
MDQTEKHVFYDNKILKETDEVDFVKTLNDKINVKYVSYGPSFENVKESDFLFGNIFKNP